MSDQPSYKILVVDDNPEDRETLSRYLHQDNRYDYQILEAELVSEALEICDRHQPDLILLDYQLPDDSGLVFLEEWQKRYGEKILIPVVVLTGQGNEMIAAEVIKRGAQDYWIKGKWSAGEVRQRIQFILQQVALQERKRNEEILQFQAQILDQIHDAVISTDINGMIQSWNQAAEKLFGYTSAEVFGQPINILHKDINFLETHIINPLLAQGSLEVEVGLYSKLGELIDVSLRLSTVRDEQGNIIRLIGCSNDIRQRKQNEETLQFQAQILERIHDAVICTDTKGKIYSWNHGAEQLYGYTATEAIGQNVIMLYFPEDLPQIYDLIFQPLLLKDNHEIELRNRTKSGEQIYVSLRLSTIRDGQGNIINMIGCSNDISERKKIEQELQQLNQELEARVEQRTAQLQASQRFIQSITDNTPNIIYIYDIEEQRNIYCNREISMILGYTPEQIQAMGASFISNLYHPDERDMIRLHHEKLKNINDHEQHHCEYRMRDVNGQWHWILSQNTVFLRGEDGQVKQVVGTAQDITERKQSEEQLRNLSDRLSLAMKSGGFGIWEWHIPQDLLIWDEQMYKLYGISKGDSVVNNYQNWVNGVHPNDREQADAAMQQALRGEQEFTPEFRVLHPDGSVRYIKAYALVQRNERGEPQRMVGLNVDITQAKEAEQQLRRVNERLTLTNAELDRATRLKDEFLANMSHELRTPLNAILGMTEGLQDFIFGDLTPRQQKAVNTIDRSGHHLLSLINDILDLAKVESGKLELQLAPTSISCLCSNSLTFVKQQAIKKNIQLITEIPDGLRNIVVDELRIRQVLINLLSNAVKFTPDGGWVKLVVQDIHSAQQHLLEFSVIDNGIGITPENASKLFKPFIQIDSNLNRQYSGTGLGLALVRRLVELHQGTVGVTSELGKGSCFTVCLPYLVSLTEISDTSGSPPQLINSNLVQPSEKKAISTVFQRETSAFKILLVEDNDLNIATISSYLGSKSYKIIVAKDGEEGVKLAKSLLPDLILMDIQLPKLDGLEAIYQIRTEQLLVSTPIIALTALAMTGDEEKCLKAGANDYISKPVKLKKLVEKIQHLLK